MLRSFESSRKDQESHWVPWSVTISLGRPCDLMMCSIAYAASTVVMVRVRMKCLRLVNLSVAVMMLVKVVPLWSRLSGRATSKSVDQDVRGPSDTV